MKQNAMQTQWCIIQTTFIKNYDIFLNTDLTLFSFQNAIAFIKITTELIAKKYIGYFK